MPPPPRPSTARRCAAIPTMANCSTAPSCRCWSTATSRNRSLTPSTSPRSTRTTASPGWCSACTRSRKSNMPPRAAISRNRCAGRSPISPRRCSPPGALRGAGDTKGALAAIDKLAGPDWYAIFKDLHAGMIAEIVRQPERSRQALRERLQARRQRAARGRGLRLLGVAQPFAERGARRLRGLRRAVAAPSADHRSDGQAQGRREAAAAGRQCAGRRRRSALRPRRFARPPRRRGSRPRLSAALALSRAVASAGAAVARRSLRVAEEAGAGDQGLRARAGDFAVAPQCR